MRMLFFGSGQFGVPSLRALAQDHDILRVVTQPDRPSGRGRRLAETAIKRKAAELELPVMTVANVNTADVTAELLSLGAEVGVVIAFGQKIGDAILHGIPGGCMNAHASLLPRHRGAAPIHYTILSGDEKAGVTIFKLVSKMDAGPILTQRWTFPKQDETTEELHDRLAGIAVDALKAALEIYRQNPNPKGELQDDAAATFAPKLKKEEGYIDFSQPAEKLARRIRALWSWPGAHCRYVSADGKREEEVILARARPAEGAPAANLSPGQMDERMFVATTDGMLEILEIKPAGSKLQLWRDFVNGRHVRAGDRFEELN